MSFLWLSSTSIYVLKNRLRWTEEKFGDFFFWVRNFLGVVVAFCCKTSYLPIRKLIECKDTELLIVMGFIY